MTYTTATRSRVYLRESAESGGTPAHELIVRAFEEAGIEDVSVHRGIMGFDRASGIMSSRPLKFHPDLPLVVEAVGEEERVRAALPGIEAMLPRGLITLSEVELYMGTG